MKTSEVVITTVIFIVVTSVVNVALLGSDVGLKLAILASGYQVMLGGWFAVRARFEI